jgi:hypothetical protein
VIVGVAAHGRTNLDPRGIVLEAGFEPTTFEAESTAREELVVATPFEGGSHTFLFYRLP